MQLEFLQQHDPAALLAVATIEEDEKSHQAYALSYGSPATGPYRLIRAVVALATAVGIRLPRRL